MEISLNLNTGRIEGAGVSRPSPQAAQAPADTVDLSRAAALEEAFHNTPEVRPEVVARARELIRDPVYPPEETIRRISHLVAANLPEDH